jgi:hypothetical protein
VKLTGNQRHALSLLTSGGQHILTGVHPRTIETLIARGLIFRLQGHNVPVWGLTANGRKLTGTPELNWIVQAHIYAIREYKDRINAREVRISYPTREGWGTSYSWSRILGGKRYSFHMVSMPNGELRYSVSRLDGEILPSGRTFSCDWTIVKQMTFKPGNGILSDDIVNAYVGKRLSKMGTIDVRHIADAVAAIADTGREDLYPIIDRIESVEATGKNDVTAIPVASENCHCRTWETRCWNCVHSFVIRLFNIDVTAELPTNWVPVSRFYALTDCE